MAISKDQIYAAIEAIEAAGQKPTTISIREHLGTGSLGTINPVLKEWREAQAPPTLPPASPSVPVPQPFIDGVQAIIPQLWTVAAETANTILAAERTARTAERDELKTALEEATALEAASAADLETAQVQNIELTKTIANLKTSHAAALEIEANARIIAEQDGAVLRATNDQMQTRIDDLQELSIESKATIDIYKTDLETARNQITDLKTIHAAALEEQTAARNKAERDAAALKATSDQLQTRIDELKNINENINRDLHDQAAEFKLTTASLKKELAVQITATHAAENRAAGAEATATAQAKQINDLQTTIAALKSDHTAQIKATNAAEKRATTAEATLAAERAKLKKEPALPLE